jgi:CheY-like chemotaxis protein
MYDLAYLQTHPLVDDLNDPDGGNRLDHISRAQFLRRTLLDAIEALRPQDQVDEYDAAMRAYAILTYRYVDGLSIDEITDRLALSRRHTYREHAKGVEALASLLWEAMPARPEMPPLPSAPDTETDELPKARLVIAQAEVDRLRQNIGVDLVEISEVIAGVCQLLAPRIEQTGVRITVESPETWPAIAVDRTMLRQALLNLLSHALDTVAGYGDLIISADPTPAELSIYIREEVNAEGHRPQVLTKRDGVGLTVAQQLIEAQGGYLQVNANAQAWRATISLPWAESTILVVDDNDSLVSLFRRFVGGYRLVIVGVNSSSEALPLARQIHPSLILLDIMMPGRDGWDVLQALRGDPETRNIPIIVCSVLKEKELALATGASDYITKPVSQPQFLAVLRRWLGTLHPAV